MLTVFINAWKVKELRNKIIYTLMILAVVRIGTFASLPGLNVVGIQQMMGNNTIYSVLVGGASSQWTIFAMGIGPYISASIIMQLLTIAIPKLEQLQKEGEEGRKKIQGYSRYLTIILAIIQSSGMVYSARNLGLYLPQSSIGVPMALVYAVSIVSMIAGTAFIMWLAEQITRKGVGNGSSMIIFINILSNMPSGIMTLYQNVVGKEVTAWIKMIIMLLLFVVIIAFVVFVQEGERRLPVQYSKKMVGRKMYGGQSSFIPIKVNTAGVISIIFAISLLQFPETIGQFFVRPDAPSTFNTVIQYLKISHPVGSVLYILLIVFFTYFYTSIVFNPMEIAENMRKNGGFVPGIRPGQPTSQYIQKIVNRVTFVGAVFYAAIAMTPVILQWIFKIPNISFGGTTILIVVGVALDTVKVLESQLLMRHYKGFLNN